MTETTFTVLLPHVQRATIPQTWWVACGEVRFREAGMGQDHHMAVLGSGWSAEGDRWTLTAEGDSVDLHTQLAVVAPDGYRTGGGSGGPALPDGRRLDVSSGGDLIGPTWMVLRLAADVRAVVITLSDGTREDLVLHGDAGVLGARVAALVHRRDLDVHRLVLHDVDGAELPDQS